MKVYIAGKMSGVENYNREKFKTAEDKLRDLGHDPFNPAALQTAGQNDLDWKGCMVRDIKVLVECDMMAMLDDWEDSKGARLEFYIAQQLGIPAVSILDMKKMNLIGHMNIIKFHGMVWTD